MSAQNRNVWTSQTRALSICHTSRVKKTHAGNYNRDDDVISAAFGRNIKNSTCVSWPDCSDQYSFRSQLWSYFAFVSVLTWLSHSKHPTLCKMKMIFHMILCLSEHHNQHNTAALTRPMMWVWGGTICLSDQWEKCRMFRKLSTHF